MIGTGILRNVNMAGVRKATQSMRVYGSIDSRLLTILKVIRLLCDVPIDHWT